jgi:predicted CoA-binding protein
MSARAVVANEFLAQRRLALVGLSRDPQHFSRGLFRELKKRGYDLVPVNPGGGVLEGEACVTRVQDIRPPVDGALVMTPPGTTEQVVRDCAEAHIPRVWLHRGMGPGAVSPAAVDFCRAHGIAVVDGECPYMFLPAAGFIHTAHGLFRRVARRISSRPAVASP